MNQPRTTPAAIHAATQTHPVLHIDDAIRATIELIAAPAAFIRQRRS
jgi:hypothetical protein